MRMDTVAAATKGCAESRPDSLTLWPVSAQAICLYVLHEKTHSSTKIQSDNSPDDCPNIAFYNPSRIWLSFSLLTESSGRRNPRWANTFLYLMPSLAYASLRQRSRQSRNLPVAWKEQSLFARERVSMTVATRPDQGSKLSGHTFGRETRFFFSEFSMRKTWLL